MHGFYDVVPRFPASEDPNFPPYQLRVLSPVESLINAIVPEEDPYHANLSEATNAVVASLIAFLIQNEQQGILDDSQMMDEVMSQILLNMDNPIVSLSQFLCGMCIHAAIHKPLYKFH